jgi:type VI secretion system secreted protein VgrG
MANENFLENRYASLVLPNKIKGFLVRAQVEETLGEIPETIVEFVTSDLDLDLGKLVGERLRIDLDAPKKKTRYFQGRCISAEYLDSFNGQAYFRAHLRPWLWFLTQTRNCQIFQDKTVIDILRDVFGKHGFSDWQDKTKKRFAKRPYCVQYRETDFDFVSRLMEEEGIYYFHRCDKTKETLILGDDVSSHSPLTDQDEVEFHGRTERFRFKDDHFFEWRGVEAIRPGKVTLSDYDFEKPKTDLQTVKSLQKGRHPYTKLELYDYPGRHADVKTGEHHARVRIEAQAAQASRAHAVGNLRQMAVGGRFKLKEHPRKAENTDYIVVSVRHEIQSDSNNGIDGVVSSILGPMLDFDSSSSPDIYRCVVEVQPAREPYRTPQRTPRPESPGMQTALVVGKKGEEIWTDKHGRVKIQFHWDRDGKKDETASCWVRCAVPWSGKGWGMMAVPRIGQEVVVQFEDGDPDRPLITGMLYNGDTKFPYDLPQNSTQFALKTNSSKKGGGFSELVFEDKKDAEFVRLQSERDFKQIIKNNAEIEIGLGHKDKGFFKQTIQGDKTEKIVEGDHAFTIAKGKATWEVADDRTSRIGGNDRLKVDKNGEIQIGAALEITAKTKITLKCGASKIEMTPPGITISSPKLDMSATGMAKLNAKGQLMLEGKGMAKLKGGGMLTVEGGGMTQVKSKGLLTVKGSLTMIN